MAGFEIGLRSSAAIWGSDSGVGAKLVPKVAGCSGKVTWGCGAGGVAVSIEMGGGVVCADGTAALGEEAGRPFGILVSFWDSFLAGGTLLFKVTL